MISDSAEKVFQRWLMFEKGVTAVREFMKEFGSDILAGLQKGFQAFKAFEQLSEKQYQEL